MIKIKEILNKSFDKKIIYILFPILVIIAKVIRYTVMKDVLVDVGIGHTLIDKVANNNAKLTIFNENDINLSLYLNLLNIFNLSTYVQFEIYISIIWNLILFFIIFKLNNKLNIIQCLFVIL